MKTRAGHLRLLPKPLAKCGPPRPYPPPSRTGVDLRRDGTGWWLTHARGGTSFEVWLTTTDLRELVEMGRELLERNEGDT